MKTTIEIEDKPAGVEFASEQEEQSPETLLDTSCCKTKTPLSKTWGQQHTCFFCQKRFEINPDGSYPEINDDPRDRYLLCHKHYIAAYLANDTAARLKSESVISEKIPRQYQTAEFTTFRVASYTDGANLKTVRDSVIQWAYDMVASCWTRQKPETSSVYLYADKNNGNTGNGCGKTHLAYAALKHIARRCMAMSKRPDDENKPLPMSNCLFIDIQELAAEFRRKQSDGERIWYRYTDWNGDYKEEKFDDYVNYVAHAPFLFIDDIGTGRYFKTDGDQNVAGTTLERIVDIRANHVLPTFYTSNFAPRKLEDRIGNRTGSRVFRADCKVIRVCAQDYSKQMCTTHISNGIMKLH